MKKMKQLLAMMTVLALGVGLCALPVTPVKVTAEERRGADDGKTLKIACVGDSLTEGTKGFSYVKNLQAMLGGSCEVRNFGYPGTSVTKNQGLTYYGSSYYTNSLAYKADVVIICIGGNDCQANIWNVGTFQKDYEELIAAYQNQGNDPLVVAMTGGYCELPDGKNQMIWGHSDQLIEQKVQPAQNAAADKLGIPRADLRAVIKPNADAYIDGDDGVHYTAAGYQAMAQLAYDLLLPLVEFPADRGALRDALADEITFFDGFTKDSVAAYKAALEKAKTVMDDAEATQEEIDAAAAALVAAFQGLTVAGTPGDVDGDEEITSTDARLTLQYYAGKIGEEDLDVDVADVDGDGEITSTDARLILQMYAGKIEDFPI